MRNARPTSTASVSLVSGGPGDPGLLTVCAVGLLASADVIVTDPECAHLVAAHAAPEAEVVIAADAEGNAADHAGVQQALSASPKAQDQALAAQMQPTHQP